MSKKDHGIVAFLKSGARYYSEHPDEKWALIISLISLCLSSVVLALVILQQRWGKL